MTRRKVGSFGKAHGLVGEVKFFPLVDADWFQPGTTILVDDTPFEIRSVRDHQNHLLVTLDGVRDRNGAEALRNIEAWTENPPELDSSEYWLEDLVGVEAFDVSENLIGTVVKVAVGPAQARLVIETESGTFEVPFVEDLVPEVDLANGRLVVDPPGGLLDGEE